MNLQDWIRNTGEISSIHVEVVELTSATHVRQYEIHVTGTQVSSNDTLSFYYTTTKIENIADLEDSLGRKARYDTLQKQSETVEDVTNDVKGEIVKLEPDPPVIPVTP